MQGEVETKNEGDENTACKDGKREMKVFLSFK